MEWLRINGAFSIWKREALQFTCLNVSVFERGRKNHARPPSNSGETPKSLDIQIYHQVYFNKHIEYILYENSLSLRVNTK